MLILVLLLNIHIDIENVHNIHIDIERKKLMKKIKKMFRK